MEYPPWQLPTLLDIAIDGFAFQRDSRCKWIAAKGTFFQSGKGTIFTI